jgi:phosphatidylserine/phosphatidylglycerophosphate/cardiolipin synthase-like enzyme
MFPIDKIRTRLAIMLMSISVLWLIAQIGRGYFAAPSVHVDPSNLDWASVYFSAPYLPSASSGRGGPDSAIAAALDRAQHTIDLAAYDLDAALIGEALQDAHSRGVRVRVVVESDNIFELIVQELEGAGIPVLGDRREALMHHKFAVIDGSEVWTGSMNFTDNGAYRNFNNLIAIRSQQVAADYTREFEEMFLEDKFGASSAKDTPFPQITVDDTELEIYFSPDDGVAEALIGLISRAKHSIHFMVFAFTSDPISASIIEAWDSGVEVGGMMDSSQARGLGSEFGRLREAGIDVRLDDFDGKMHHKVMIIDAQIVVTGSYNFSQSAEERNDENVLVIYDAAIANLFLEEFERIFEGSA